MIIIDMSHLFMRNFHMMKKDILEYEKNAKGEMLPTGKLNEGYMIHLIFNSVLTLANKFKASITNEVVLALDSKPSWRNDFYIKHSKKFEEYKNQTYKGNRKKDESVPWDKLWETFNEGVQALDLYSDFKVIKVDLAEADDVIAVLARNAPINEDVYVCSGDKDFHQLQTDNIHLYDPIKKKILAPIDVERSKQLHFILAGDDNLKQIKKGVGIKTAEKILNEGLDDYFKINPELKERYEFNQKMIDFDFIPKEVEKEILLMYNNYNKGTFNHSKLLSFCSKKQMRQMAVKLNQFKLIQRKDVYKPASQKVIKNVVETSIEDFFS